MDYTISIMTKHFNWILGSFLLLTSCGNPLATEGKVHVWSNRPDPELISVSEKLGGLTFTEAPRNQSWNLLIKTPATSPDLILTDLSHEVLSGASSGILADLTPYRSRMTSAPLLWPGLARLSASNRFPAFLPSSLHLWRLFYNKDVLSLYKIARPTTLKDLEDSFEILKSQGIIPVALGSSFGWPALAWLSILDLRFNGADAHWRLINGERNFSDPSFQPVLETLVRWRDKQFFDPESGLKNWPESLTKVREGKAAFTFMGSSVVTRLGGSASINSIPIPSLDGREEKSEIAAIQGWVLNSEAKSPEAAMALADTYVALGSQGQTSDLYKVAAIRPGKEFSLAGIKADQAESLSAGVELVLQMERILEPKAAYDVTQVMIRFFSPHSTLSATVFAKELDEAMNGN